MNRFTRAILMALPISRDSSAERAYRSELRTMRDRGWVEQGEEQWARTLAGSAVIGLPHHESGTQPAVAGPRPGSVPPPPPAPPKEPVLGIFVRAPHSVTSAIDAAAEAAGVTRNAEMLELLQEALRARGSAPRRAAAGGASVGGRGRYSGTG